jgi:hypothetical protein
MTSVDLGPISIGPVLISSRSPRDLPSPRQVHLLHLDLMEWSQPRVSLEGPAPRGRHTAEAYGSVLFIFGGGAEGKVFDDFWALDGDGQGMARLEQAAARKGLGPVRGLDDDGGTALDSGLAFSFLLPQMGERHAVAAEAEYDDVEAREADADEVRGPWIRTPWSPADPPLTSR